MKEPTLDVARSIGDLLERRVFLGKAGALSLGAVFAALGRPEVAGAFASVPPPTTYSTLLGTCTDGAGTSAYTPGITNSLQGIHCTGSVTFSPGCAVAQNKVIMRCDFSLDMIASCSQVTDMSGTNTIVYSAGQNSNWALDSWSAIRLLGQVISVNSGLITHGPFNGARVWGFAVRTTNAVGACASAGGLADATGSGTFIIAMP